MSGDGVTLDVFHEVYFSSPAPGPWALDGACRGLNPSLFLAERGDNVTIREAKAVCATCPVVEECRAYGLSQPWLHGVWGGLSQVERRRTRATRCVWCGTPGDACCEPCAAWPYDQERRHEMRAFLKGAA